MEDTRTHYVPAFTRKSSSGLEQAVCGSYVEPAYCVVGAEKSDRLPTCNGCRMWVENLDFIEPEPAATLSRTA